MDRSSEKISKSDKNKLILLATGGAQAYAVIVTDYTKNGGIRAIALNDSSMLTCLSNDYSYEVFSRNKLAIMVSKMMF